MPHMTTRTCKCCKVEFQARTADVNRGWAKFCSKSCKAKKQEQRTHQHRNHHFNYRGSGVSRETYVHYAKEYGGIPQFSRSGDYQGFLSGPFDNTEHQDSGDK